MQLSKDSTILMIFLILSLCFTLTIFCRLLQAQRQFERDESAYKRAYQVFIEENDQLKHRLGNAETNTQYLERKVREQASELDALKNNTPIAEVLPPV